MASRFITRLALLGLWFTTVLVCSAWLSTVVSSYETAPADADYMWHPVEIGAIAKLVLGLATTAATVVVAVLVRRWSKTGVLSRTWLVVFVAVAAVAGYCGMTYAIATAPVIGANIGGGMVVLFAGPFVVGTAIVAAVWVHRGHGTPPA